jgi:site-specific DNA recombinase
LPTVRRKLFKHQIAPEKRQLLDFVLSNSIWKNGQLTAFRQPFDLIAETAEIATTHSAANDDFSTGHMVWLPGPDSNQRPTG